MLVSIIIRTLNEEKYLDELLKAVDSQITNNFSIEVIIVDSGSQDKTLEIAKSYQARIAFINKDKFTFGRSLNVGCELSNGGYLVFISGHCIPTNKDWLSNLVEPLIQGLCKYTYGRQVGRDSTKFSEKQVFKKYFSNESSIPQDGYFCNNANAAITRSTWLKYRFNEDLTGLEDMFLAKNIYYDGLKIGYVASSCVYHIHNESWSQVKTRYEREAIALQKIMPEIKVELFDMFHFIFIGILKDMRLAFMGKVLLKELKSILTFRVMQYYGSYKGNHRCRELSYKTKMRYFYPRAKKY